MAKATPSERQVWIGLGANLGNPRQTLDAAINALRAWAEQSSDADFKVASMYRSQSLGAPGPDYLNTVASFQSDQTAINILEAIQAIENVFGRQRSYPNAPRTLDLDLLMVGNEKLESQRLTVPHPRMTQRAFVLKPMAELDPTLRIDGKGIDELILACAHQDCEKLAP